MKALDVFLDPLPELEAIKELATDYSDSLSERKNPDDHATAKAQEIHNEAQSLYTTLEDLVSEAIMGADSFADDFRDHKLKFQRAHTR